jgi:hypothetical protein
MVPPATLTPRLGHRGSVRRTLSIPLLAVLALVLGGCELSVALDVRVDRGGGGSVDLRVALDEELRTILADAGVDVLRDLSTVQDRNPEWTITPEETEDGGLEVSLAAAFDDPDGFGALMEELHRGLDAEDPRIAEGLRLERRDGGEVAFLGRVGLVPPTAPGARGGGVGFDEEALERLIDERGDEFARYDVRVTLPASPREHDGDAVDATSVTWHAPIGEMREVSAVSERPAIATGLVALIVALVGFAAAFLATRLLRR